ncbi:hypothetical protein VTJ49DRAFT_3951 [Mycothermus thermophilus]|uniref:Biotrophy-associated secreted protein 2 n=1 Tax=Humicola insolens TaxID=85995 RepID=A0ABR3V6I4_HUMIN
MVRLTVVGLLTFSLAITAQVIPNNAGARNVGQGNGQQFITGGCVNNADCASGCCAGNGQGLGVCSAPPAQFQNGKTGCGFVDPNAQRTIDAAKAQVARQESTMLRQARYARFVMAWNDGEHGT